MIIDDCECTISIEEYNEMLLHLSDLKQENILQARKLAELRGYVCSLQFEIKQLQHLGGNL